MQDDGPDEAECELGVAVHNVLAPDVDQLDLLVAQEAQRRLHVLDGVEAHAPALSGLQQIKDSGWRSRKINVLDRALSAVLRIHDILVRIRIRRSMPLTNGSGSCFSSLTYKMPNKNLKNFFCLLPFEGISFFEDRKAKRSHKTVGIKVFLTILV